MRQDNTNGVLRDGDLLGRVLDTFVAPKAKDTAHLAWLRDALGDRFIAGVLFHTGPRTYHLAERITAHPSPHSGANRPLARGPARARSSSPPFRGGSSAR